MKKLSKLLALSVLAAIFNPLAAEAATGCFISLTNQAGLQIGTKYGSSYTSDANGVICGVAPQDTGSVEAAGFVSLGDPQATVPFSSNMIKNPSVLLSYNDVPTDVLVSGLTSASNYTLIASATGRQIVPTGGITIMASGTAGTATGVALECSDGTLIASWPIAELVTNVPVGLYASTGGPGLSTALTKGCASGTSLVMSNIGTNLTTTTHLYVSIPYIAF
jgi:hypothetical protein